jgi:2,3-bisphosphoglycerate-independent phosphoglycerate mutase
MAKQFAGFIILDGWGMAKPGVGNAVHLANTPNFDRLMKEAPHTSVCASGLCVGLPDGQMGNSEVGHLNIGAGRIIYQFLTKITKDIEDGTILENQTIKSAMADAAKNDKALHFMGLVSQGGVHSHVKHLYGFLRMAKDLGVKKAYIHVFLDGRDVAPNAGLEDVRNLEAEMKLIGLGEIATVSGRYYAMDRDNRWDRVELAYKAMVQGVGPTNESAVDTVSTSYEGKVFDEFVLPTVITKNGAPITTIEDGDSVIFTNFRPDRAREITRAIVDETFTGFKREKKVSPEYVCLTTYDATIENVSVAYPPVSYKNTLGEYVASKGLKQLRIAETEKYAHVTFFFNGGVETPNVGEDRVLIPSPKVATYDLQPEMSAVEVKDNAVERIRSGEYDLMILNFANPDMVGHTGIIDAAVKAVETVDACLGEVLAAIEEIGGKAIITADHGNSEQMLTEKGDPMTAHTTNLVPAIFVGTGDVELREGGILADFAPTLLEMMNVEIPEEMTGKSLIKK